MINHDDYMVNHKIVMCYHCIISTSILKNHVVFSLSLRLQSLLHDPNPNSPANNEAAQLYRENRREYEKKVAFIVQESFNDDDDD